MHPTRLLLAAIACGLLSVGAAAPALAATAAPTPGIGLAPAHHQPGGVGYLIEHARAGQTVRDQVLVANPGTVPARLLVNAVDGLTSTASGAVYANRQDPLRQAGRWVSPPVPVLVVPASSRNPLTFTVHVPADAAPGDHLAGLAFESAPTSRRSGVLTVRTVDRSVIGILIQVAGPVTTAMSLTGARLAPLTGIGSAALDITMADTGGRLVKPLLHVAMTGAAGYHRQLTRQLDTVLPGDAITLPQPWPDRLRPGAYHLAVRLTAPGMAPVAYSGSAQIGRVLPATVAGMKPVLHAPGGSSGTPPALLAVLAAAVLLLVGGARFLLRRRAPAGRGRHAGTGAAHRAPARSTP